MPTRTTAASPEAAAPAADLAPIQWYINIGAAGSFAHNGVGADSQFTVRPFIGVDAIFWNAALVGVEFETAFGQTIFSERFTSPGKAWRAHSTESFRSSARIGYVMGPFVPYLRAGAILMRHTGTSEIGLPYTFTPASMTASRDRLTPYIGIGLQANYGNAFARIEANRINERYLFDPIQAAGLPAGTASIDYEIRAAAGIRF